MSENAVDNHLWGDPVRGDGFSSLPRPALCFYRAKSQTLPTAELQLIRTPEALFCPTPALLGCSNVATTTPTSHHSPQPQHSMMFHTGSSGLQRFSTRGRVLPAVSRQAVTRVIVLCSPQVPPMAAEAGCCESS